MGVFKSLEKIRNSVFKEDLNYFLQWWKEAVLTRINDMRAPDVKNNWQEKAIFGWLCVYVKTAIATLQIIIAEKTLGYYYQLVLHSTTVRRFCNFKFSLDKSTIFSYSPNGFTNFESPISNPELWLVQILLRRKGNNNETIIWSIWKIVKQWGEQLGDYMQYACFNQLEWNGKLLLPIQITA